MSLKVYNVLTRKKEEFITEYYYDIIMHMTDNSYQNDEINKILTKYKI